MSSEEQHHMPEQESKTGISYKLCIVSGVKQMPTQCGNLNLTFWYTMFSSSEASEFLPKIQLDLCNMCIQTLPSFSPSLCLSIPPYFRLYYLLFSFYFKVVFPSFKVPRYKTENQKDMSGLENSSLFFVPMTYRTCNCESANLTVFYTTPSVGGKVFNFDEFRNRTCCLVCSQTNRRSTWRTTGHYSIPNPLATLSQTSTAHSINVYMYR